MFLSDLFSLSAVSLVFLLSAWPVWFFCCLFSLSALYQIYLLPIWFVCLICLVCLSGLICIVSLSGPSAGLSVSSLWFLYLICLLIYRSGLPDLSTDLFVCWSPDLSVRFCIWSDLSGMSSVWSVWSDLSGLICLICLSNVYVWSSWSICPLSGFSVLWSVCSLSGLSGFSAVCLVCPSDLSGLSTGLTVWSDMSGK